MGLVVTGILIEHTKACDNDTKSKEISLARFTDFIVLLETFCV